MKRPLQGRYAKVATAGESFKAFVPAPLPPRPPVDWTAPLRSRFDAALLALGRLDAVTDLLPNAALLLYSFVRKEAVLSSMIEGTQSSLADLMLFELDEQPGVPIEDAREVSLYVAALEHGLKRLLELGTADARRIEGLGRAAVSALAVHRALQRQPIATAASLVTATELTAATVNKSLAHLERLGIVAELTSRQRGRVFSYRRYADILNEGMEPPDGGGRR